jgi:hypothetical protein
MRKQSHLQYGEARVAWVLSLLTTLSCANTEPDVTVAADALYIGTLYSMTPSETRTLRLPDPST